MATNHHSDKELLRAQIAVAAARLIVEDGADYGTAKRKAAKRILGHLKIRADIQPGNAQIENEVRTYNNLFFHGIQPARLLFLQKLAVQIMKELEQFTPYLTGAVLNGTASKHSDIHLQLFTESSKNVELFLLNKNIKFDIFDTIHIKGHNKPVEMVSFLWNNEIIYLTIYRENDLHKICKKTNNRMKHATIADVQALIIENQA